MAVRSDTTHSAGMTEAAGEPHRIGFTRQEWWRLGGLFGFVAFLHVAGWGLFLYYAARYHQPGFAGAGALAYTFGLRHAFDADHLAAILNLVVLLGIVKLWRQMKTGAFDRERLEELMLQRGFMNRLLGKRFRKFINESWHMYPVGFLFGLGFDTASEIALLAITGAAASSGHLPPMAIISLPILFAAGMSALDTADGAFMAKAYGWAFSSPLRKIYYNITTTGLSVAVALVIGTIELVGVLGDKLHQTGMFWGFVGRISDDFELFGYIIVGMFVLTWAGSVILWKARRIEERWGPAITD